jgi:hypothetical protein
MEGWCERCGVVARIGVDGDRGAGVEVDAGKENAGSRLGGFFGGSSMVGLVGAREGNWRGDGRGRGWSLLVEGS